jgi:hypothetical protein
MPVATETDVLMGLLENPLNVIVAHAARNPIAPDVDKIELADLTECNFPGYAPVTLDAWTPDPPEFDEVGEAVSGDVSFTAGAIVTPQNITAVYLTLAFDGGAPVLLKVFPLPSPFLMNLPEQKFARLIRYQSVADPD